MGYGYEFVINGRMPGLNEYINKERSNRYMGSKMKKEWNEVTEYAIRQQLKRVQIIGQVRLHYIFYEMNNRRDLDNVAGFAHKIIQDALVRTNVIKDDSPKYVVGFTDKFAIDRENPRILVMIEVV